ncbi:MAG: hypothetical protein J7K11_07190 [Candidatus Hydrothermae bacterium]|nr:hypothetical protein [Candidatus Hydrothermae bacterium]
MKVKYMVMAVVATLALVGGAWAADCVEIDIEAPSSAYIGQTVTISGEVTNCGDEAGFVQIKGTLRKDGVVIQSNMVTFYLAAGETKSEAVRIYIPEDSQYVGTYTACVEARIGSAIDSDCATMEVLPRKDLRTKRISR